MAVKTRYSLFRIALFVSVTLPVYAQNPPPPKNAPPPPPGLQLPIDDHIWVLLVLGLALGVYFLVKGKATSAIP